MRHLIAYKDLEGNDFCGYPWLIEGFVDLIEVIDKKTSLELEGYKDVFIFICDANTPEVISWEYVFENLIRI